MGDFAIIAEGITDQVVIKNLLLGIHADQDEEPFVTFEQPRLDESARQGEHAAGGWTLVLQYFREGLYKQALQTNTYLVIHIDTDISEDYGVGKGSDGGALIGRVVAKFQALVEDSIWQAHGDRFIFAIAVHEIECWLLPLLFETQRAKMAKITGCFDAAEHQLKKLGRPRLTNREGGKDPFGYEKASADYRKYKVLMRLRGSNSSLNAFVTEVERRNIVIPTTTG
ncbi:MAG: hypothetical protein H0T76_08615 [Nannocystis sp.]|nr:hypothetical protein [Nannocystis sp.]MBA3546530.1 hypothetical protein [Nannocystis sp.]